MPAPIVPTDSIVAPTKQPRSTQRDSTNNYTPKAQLHGRSASEKEPAHGTLERDVESAVGRRLRAAGAGISTGLRSRRASLAVLALRLDEGDGEHEQGDGGWLDRLRAADLPVLHLLLGGSADEGRAELLPELRSQRAPLATIPSPPPRLSVDALWLPLMAGDAGEQLRAAQVRRLVLELGGAS